MMPHLVSDSSKVQSEIKTSKEEKDNKIKPRSPGDGFKFFISDVKTLKESLEKFCAPHLPH